MPKKTFKMHSRRKHKKSTKRHYKSRKPHKSNKTHRKYRKQRKIMKGGYGPGAGPVGYAWKSDPSTWPGAYASNGGNTNGMTFSNYYQYNTQGTGVGGPDPAISTRGDLADLHYQSGGGVTQDLINLGDSVNYKFSDFFSKLYGSVNQSVDPNVTKQFLNSEDTTNTHNTLNLDNIVKTSANKAASI